MSEGYKDGKSTPAYNITCEIKPDPPSHEERTMTVTVYELSPFAESANYCLHIENDKDPVLCSGSKTFLSISRPYASTTGWTFQMTLKEFTAVPNIRFWMTIASEHFNLLIGFNHNYF